MLHAPMGAHVTRAHKDWVSGHQEIECVVTQCRRRPRYQPHDPPVVLQTWARAAHISIARQHSDMSRRAVLRQAIQFICFRIAIKRVAQIAVASLNGSV